MNIYGKLLAIDTSTRSLTTALLENGRLIAEKQSLAERNHSIYLVPMIAQLLQSSGTKREELAAIAVGRGPGSYTGVRIGVTVAKTMAWTLGIPLYGVSSLEGLALGGGFPAEEGPSKTRWIVPLMDARRGQVYTALFSASPDGWSRHAEDGIRLLADWMEKLANRLAGKDLPYPLPDEVVFIGETEPFRGAILEHVRDWPGIMAVLNHDLRAYHIGAAAYGRMMEAEQDDVHSLTPNYTQLAEAEVKWLARQQQPSQGGEGHGGAG